MSLWREEVEVNETNNMSVLLLKLTKVILISGHGKQRYKKPQT